MTIFTDSTLKEATVLKEVIWGMGRPNLIGLGNLIRRGRPEKHTKERPGEDTMRKQSSAS